MQWYDWLIVILPTLFVLGMGVYSHRYLRDVTTFLSAGRVCGRYVISVGDVASGLSIIGLVSYVEIHYRTGFSVAFWSSIMLPVGVILGLFGYCTYRFRETKAQSIGQYLEMRYSRKFRIFAAGLRSVSEMLANMIMPALAARFFIYFLDLPRHFMLFGMEISTFHLLMLIILFMAIFIICVGGSMGIIVTDTIQGFICYPLLALFCVFVLVKFSWMEEILPVMMDRVDNQSFLDPTDISDFRDFNLFSLLALPIIQSFLARMNWIGAGSSSSAAKSPHEQKMASLLGTWRVALGAVFYVLVAVAVLTLLNHHDFSKEAHDIRVELTDKVAQEVILDKDLKTKVVASIKAMPPVVHKVGKDPKLSDKNNIDTKYLNVGHKALTADNVDEGNRIFPQFRALYYQLLMPVTLRNMLPPGMLGLFCLLMVLLMISTDDTRIFSAAVTLNQDVFLPLRKKELTPREHMWMLRWIAIGIGIFFFLGSSFMAQLDYIALYVTLVTTMWIGGSGPMLVLGIYTRFGTTQGAWTSLGAGVGMGCVGVAVQRNWASHIYPWLRDNGWADSVGSVLQTISKPLNPYVVWEMNPTRCPINSYEWLFITMVTTLVLYVVVSLLTCKAPFNLERMLHRGKYSLGEDRQITSKWTWKNVFDKLIGVTPEYTKGDKFVAWSYFVYSFIYKFGFAFILVVVWNMFDPWPAEYWGWYFLIVSLVVPGIMAAVTAVWFGIGGAIDLKDMFRSLATREINALDDGRVEGNLSLADKKELEAVDREMAKEKETEAKQ